jgi:hypothetical protein
MSVDEIKTNPDGQPYTDNRGSDQSRRRRQACPPEWRVFHFRERWHSHRRLRAADELEDYLELRDPNIQRIVKQSARDLRAGRTRPTAELLAEFTKTAAKENQTARFMSPVPFSVETTATLDREIPETRLIGTFLWI